MDGVNNYRIAPRAIQNHLDRLIQLYEQTCNQPANMQAARVDRYRAKWVVWAKSVTWKCVDQVDESQFDTYKQALFLP